MDLKWETFDRSSDLLVDGAWSKAPASILSNIAMPRAPTIGSHTGQFQTPTDRLTDIGRVSVLNSKLGSEMKGC